MMLRIVLTSALLSTFLVGPAAFAGQADGLNAPAYVDPDEPFEALWRGEAVTASYATGEDFEEAVVTDTGDGQRIRIPALGDTDAESLTLRITSQASGEVLVEQSLPVPEVAYHDITGDAAIVLTFPIEGFEGHARFIPCCTIYNGLLRIMTLETNPANTADGLPAKVEKPFVVLKPDHLAATTSGTGLVMKFGQAPAEGLEPAAYSYNEKIGQWERISDPDVDAVERTLTIACPNGGAFALGWAER